MSYRRDHAVDLDVEAGDHLEGVDGGLQVGAVAVPRVRHGEQLGDLGPGDAVR